MCRFDTTKRSFCAYGRGLCAGFQFLCKACYNKNNMDNFKTLILRAQRQLDIIIDSAQHARTWLKEIKNHYSEIDVRFIKEYTDAIEELSKSVSKNLKELQKTPLVVVRLSLRKVRVKLDAKRIFFIFLL